MKFDMNHISTIYESATKEEKMQYGDETGANLDNTLGQNDLLKLYDEICPISGDVFASMKDAASDPKNLKLTMVKEKDLDEATVYVEAVEFATFCEAADLNPGEAAEEIENCCKEMVPGLNKSELHVVFPCDSLNKGGLGSTRRGLDVNNDWAVQLLTGCRRYGIAVNSGIEDGEPVTESVAKKNESLSESFFNKRKHSKKSTRYSSNTNSKKGYQHQNTVDKMYRGQVVCADEPCNNIDEIFKLCDKHWNKIIEGASEKLLSRLYGYPDIDIPEKDKAKSGMKKYLKFSGGIYNSDKYKSISLYFNITFDENHAIDVDISFDENSNISIDCGFSG